MTAALDARETTLLQSTQPVWIERWREPGGAVTVARLTPITSIVLFGGTPTDASADWLGLRLSRALEGQHLLHFIDQSLLERPNTEVRSLYMSTLKRRYRDIDRAHVYVGDKPLLKMISSAANMVFSGLGKIHDSQPSFDAALLEAVSFGARERREAR